MRLSTILIVTMIAVGAIALVRAAKGAELHPAMTSERGPGWQLQRALPGEEFKPRGRFFDTATGCQLDLASDRNAMPTGARLVCMRIEGARR